MDNQTFKRCSNASKVINISKKAMNNNEKKLYDNSKFFEDYYTWIQ